MPWKHDPIALPWNYGMAKDQLESQKIIEAKDDILDCLQEEEVLRDVVETGQSLPVKVSTVRENGSVQYVFCDGVKRDRWLMYSTTLFPTTSTTAEACGQLRHTNLSQPKEFGF